MQGCGVTLALLVSVLVLLVHITAGGPVGDSVRPRVRRSTADQRLAELQVLLYLSEHRPRQLKSVLVPGYGEVDPQFIGKRKRDFNEEERYQMLKSLIERAAAQNLPERYQLLKSLLERAAAQNLPQ